MPVKPLDARSSTEDELWGSTLLIVRRAEDQPKISCVRRYARAVEVGGGTTFSIHPLMTSNT
jgi:hypothetical protein